jgi:hypothetical protein
MATTTDTFRLMASLPAAERDALECRFDGEIPHDVVVAALARHGVGSEHDAMTKRADTMWRGAMTWLRKGNAKAAEYRLAGNPEAARSIRHQYRDIARQCLEERRGLLDALNANSQQAAE